MVETKGDSLHLSLVADVAQAEALFFVAVRLLLQQHEERQPHRTPSRTTSRAGV